MLSDLANDKIFLKKEEKKTRENKNKIRELFYFRTRTVFFFFIRISLLVRDLDFQSESQLRV